MHKKEVPLKDVELDKTNKRESWREVTLPEMVDMLTGKRHFPTLESHFGLDDPKLRRDVQEAIKKHGAEYVAATLMAILINKGEMKMTDKVK